MVSIHYTVYANGLNRDVHEGEGVGSGVSIFTLKGLATNKA